MSRVGKKAIVIPKEVDLNFDGEVLSVKGPKGELRRFIHPKIKLSINGSKISLSISDNSKESKSLFRVELSGNQLVFNLGYSHLIKYDVPTGIEVKIDQRNTLVLSSVDKELLGVTAAKIRSFKAPEPYKGKGIKYLDERVRRKAGKTGATT
jgi:large subunit ribosomal protein L6